MWIGASLNEAHIDVKYVSHFWLQRKGAKIAIASVEAMSCSAKCSVNFISLFSSVGEIFQSHYSR